MLLQATSFVPEYLRTSDGSRCPTFNIDPYHPVDWVPPTCVLEALKAIQGWQQTRFRAADSSQCVDSRARVAQNFAHSEDCPMPDPMPEGYELARQGEAGVEILDEWRCAPGYIGQAVSRHRTTVTLHGLYFVLPQCACNLESLASCG